MRAALTIVRKPSIGAWLVVSIVAGLNVSPQKVHAQNADFNKMLDQVEQAGAWQQAPAPQPVSPNMQQPQFGVSSLPQPFNAQQQTVGQPFQQMPQHQPVHQPQGLFGGLFGPPQPKPAPKPLSPLQQLMQSFMGSGASSSGNNAANESLMGNIRNDLQIARDQAQQAQDASNSISGQSDKGVKQDLASQAQYHANAACEAADRAYNNACTVNSSDAQGLASAARGAANQAQSAASRAQANASY